MAKVEWRDYLEIANNALKDQGVELTVTEDGGCYALKIKYGDGTVDDYAGGYYESELALLINEAWNFALAESLKHADRTIKDKDMPLKAFEKQTFDQVKQDVVELGVPLDRNWTLTYSREYSYDMKNIWSRCIIMDGDKKIFRTGACDDVSEAAMRVLDFIEGVKSVLKIEEEESVASELKG